jgi:hypothetical protein
MQSDKEVRRKATRHRRFQLSMQAWTCILLVATKEERRMIEKEYCLLARWRRGYFRV